MLTEQVKVQGIVIDSRYLGPLQGICTQWPHGFGTNFIILFLIKRVYPIRPAFSLQRPLGMPRISNLSSSVVFLGLCRSVDASQLRESADFHDR